MSILGAIIGDIVGSAYERGNTSWQGKWEDIPLFPAEARFTDDTVLTTATAEALLESQGHKPDFKFKFSVWGNKYPKAGYGQKFRQWLIGKNKEPYFSFGNGSAMRVSPVAWIAKNLEEALELAKMNAIPTHNHPDGIAGAQATAAAIWLARNGSNKSEIKSYIENKFGYNLHRTLEEIRNSGYKFSSRCITSVPEAIIAFLESESYEEAIRKAIWLRGDADTQAAIAGSIACAVYEIPQNLLDEACKYLPKDILNVAEKWNKLIENSKKNKQ